MILKKLSTIWEELMADPEFVGNILSSMSNRISDVIVMVEVPLIIKNSRC